MNEIDAQVVALIGRFVAALMAIACGALFVRWGANLYLAGVRGKSGTIKTVLKDAQFILSNGAPGTFLSAGGVIVMVTALMTMPEYDKGRVAGTVPEKVESNPLQQQFRPAVVASTGTPPSDTAHDVPTSAPPPAQVADTSASPVQPRQSREASAPQFAVSEPPPGWGLDIRRLFSDSVTYSEFAYNPQETAAFVQGLTMDYGARSQNGLTGLTPRVASYYARSGDRADQYRFSVSIPSEQATAQAWCPPTDTGQFSAMVGSTMMMINSTPRYQNLITRDDTTRLWLSPPIPTQPVPTSDSPP